MRARASGLVIPHLVPLVVAVVFLLPLLWMVTASLRQPGLAPPRTIEWLPDPIVLENYASVFESSRSARTCSTRSSSSPSPCR